MPSLTPAEQQQRRARAVRAAGMIGAVWGYGAIGVSLATRGQLAAVVVAAGALGFLLARRFFVPSLLLELFAVSAALSWAEPDRIGLAVLGALLVAAVRAATWWLARLAART